MFGCLAFPIFAVRKEIKMVTGARTVFGSGLWAEVVRRVRRAFPVRVTPLSLSAVAIVVTGAGIGTALAQPGDGGTYYDRQQWFFGIYDGHNIRTGPKAGLPDALGRLAFSGGNDAEALQYISGHPATPRTIFDYPWIAKALYAYGDRFTPQQRDSIRSNLVQYADDLLFHGTENHAIKRVTSAYLFAQQFPNQQWNLAGRGQPLSSQQLMSESKDLLIRRSQGFLRSGNNEQLSSTYAFLNATAWLNIYDYADDPQLKSIANAQLHYHLGTVAPNSFDGHIMPPLNRRAPQAQASVPSDGFMPVHHQMSWLLWGQNQIHERDLLSSAEPAFALSFAMSSWQPPDVIDRIANGADAGYAVRSGISRFSFWGDDDRIETQRYMWRDENFAIGAVVGQHFNPGGFFLDYDLVNVVWKSDNRHRQLEVVHPYWRSNNGINARQETHSPFLQSAAHENTVIVMFNIPDEDPWGGRGDPGWIAQRDQHIEDLLKIGIVRFPHDVQEKLQQGDSYFFRDGDMYVGIRALKPNLEFASGGSGWFDSLRSREAQTGFVIEVGTPDQHESFEAFRQAVLANPLTVDWNTLEAQYTNSQGQVVRMRMAPTEYDPDAGRFWIRPDVWINGEALDATNWPVFESPVVNMQDGVMTIEQGPDRRIVRWDGVEWQQIGVNSTVSLDFVATNLTNNTTTFTGEGVLNTPGDGTTWNAVSLTNNTIQAGNLVNSEGRPTDVSVSIQLTSQTSSINDWAYDSGHDLLDNYIFLFQNTGQTASAEIVISNLLADTLYNIVFYTQGDQPGQGARITLVGGDPRTAAGSIPGMAYFFEGLNYIAIQTMTDESGQLIFSWTLPGGPGVQGWSALNGMQIQAIPEPTTLAWIGAGLIIGCRPRRRRR
jgi:hypothetical protein